MQPAQLFYNAIEKLTASPGKIVFIAVDWGPGTQAEMESQTAGAIEHLMRKRIPFALISIYQLAPPFMKEIPLKIKTKLEAESPGEEWVYGKDWVNFGFQPGSGTMIQSLARTSRLAEELKADVFGTPFADIPAMTGVTTIKDIPLLIEFTSLVGAFNAWLQFFQIEGYRPPLLHGCTSITIPEAHIYLASGQILGLHEGIAGAAHYDTLLSNDYPNRKPGIALKINTGLAFAQLLVLGLIILGNIGHFVHQYAANQQKALGGHR